MLASSEIRLSCAAGSAVEGVAHDSSPGQDVAWGRLIEKIRLYSRLLLQLVEEAENCRKLGRWTKAARLECEAGFFGSQIAKFRDALSKATGDECALPAAAAVPSAQSDLTNEETSLRAVQFVSTDFSDPVSGTVYPRTKFGEYHGQDYGRRLRDAGSQPV